MVDKTMLDACIKLREEKGFVRVYQARFGDYKKEAVLDVSANGYQFTSVSLSETEAKKTIQMLSDFYGFEVKFGKE